MTDHSATIRTMNGAAANGETTADVLASIRRLIAQDESSVRRDPPLRRASPDVTANQSARPEGDASDSRPLRLRQDALIPPAEVRPESRERRLRLATAQGGEVQDDTNRMAQIIRAATSPRDSDTMRPIHTEPVRAEHVPAPATARDIPPHAEVPTTPEAQKVALSVPTKPAAAAVVPGKADPNITAAAQMAQAELRSRRPTDDAGDSTALHLFAPADEDIPNGTILRSLLREAIRQELQGEMGGRFSRNLRRVIRQEVACAIDEAMGRRAPGDKPAI